MRFDSTPRNPTAKAKEARRIIQLCEHGAEHTDAVAAANEALDHAEMLIGAIEKQTDSNVLLNAAIIKERRRLLDRAAELEAEALRILSVIEQEGADGGGLGDFSGLADRARGYLNHAREKIAPLRQSRPVRRDVEAAWRRYRSVRARLNTLQQG